MSEIPKDEPSPNAQDGNSDLGAKVALGIVFVSAASLAATYFIFEYDLLGVRDLLLSVRFEHLWPLNRNAMIALTVAGHSEADAVTFALVRSTMWLLIPVFALTQARVCFRTGAAYLGEYDIKEVWWLYLLVLVTPLDNFKTFSDRFGLNVYDPVLLNLFKDWIGIAFATLMLGAVGGKLALCLRGRAMKKR